MAATTRDAQGQTPVSVRINTDALLKAAGVEVPDATQPQREDHGGSWLLRATGAEKQAQRAEQKQRFVAGDPSVLSALEGCESSHSYTTERPDMGFVPQVLSSTRHKLAETQRAFWSFVLPDGHLLTPRQRLDMVKEAFAAGQMPGQVPTSANVPLPQAQAAMQQFLPGKPMMAGQGVRPTGLDGPSDTTAEAMPGTPGHAATNVIDRMGGLDPRGQTVDGNNAAGVPKGFKMGSAQMPTVGDLLLAAAEKAASFNQREEREGEDDRFPWFPVLSGGALTGLVLARLAMNAGPSAAPPVPVPPDANELIKLKYPKLSDGSQPPLQKAATDWSERLRALWERRDPDKIEQDNPFRESCESSHSDVKQAADLFAVSELSQLLQQQPDSQGCESSHSVGAV